LYFQSISPEKKKESKKKYYTENKKKISIKNKEYREKNKEKLSIKNKEYREKNKEVLSNKKKEYINKNKDEFKKNRKEWEKNNPDKLKSYKEKYLKSDKVNEHRKSWYKSIKKRKPFVLAWRSLLNNTLKRINTKKEEETIKLLGYSAIQLKEHIENLFLNGMTWNNYGQWHIDHIKMVSSFAPDTPVHIINSLDNLRPLWAEDNCSRKYNI
jgi:hypothetical protein